MRSRFPQATEIVRWTLGDVPMKHDQLEGLAQALFEESGDALFLFDPESQQLLDANSTGQRLSGFPLRELLHFSLPQLFRFEGPGGMQPLVSASRKTGVFHSGEGYAMRTIKDGVWIPVHLTTARLHVKPKTLGLITARDDRGQYEAHQQLKGVEAQLRRVMASVSDCLWSAEVDNTGQCVYRYFSPVAERITGHPAEYFMEGIHRWWSLVHPDDQARWAKALARLRAGQSCQEDYRLLLADGSIRWVHDSVLVSREKDALRLDGVITDITQRKQAELDLKEKDDRFHSFMNNSPAIAFMKDLEGRFIYHNRPFQRFFQQGEGGLAGKTDFDLFPPEVARKLQENDVAVVSANRTIETVERIPTPDGVMREWLVFKFPFQDAAGRNLIGGVAVDITDRRGLQNAKS
jgi:two-component system, cell cycle sensor histidine kinase and response regulator CckA